MFLRSPDYGKTKRRYVSIFMRYVLVIAMLVISFVYVPEGYRIAEENVDGAVNVQKGTSYLVKCEEGYKLYVDGVYVYTCSILHDEFSGLPIIEEEELK